jgi:hypothetical protein
LIHRFRDDRLVPIHTNEFSCTAGQFYVPYKVAFSLNLQGMAPVYGIVTYLLNSEDDNGQRP